MLKKKTVKKSDKVSVTFSTEEFKDAKKISLVGEFNQWQPTKTPMKQRRDGVWAVTLRLAGSSRYEYRFVVDGTRWVTDPQADELVHNQFGEQNSVVLLPDPRR